MKQSPEKNVSFFDQFWDNFSTINRFSLDFSTSTTSVGIKTLYADIVKGIAHKQVSPAVRVKVESSINQYELWETIVVCNYYDKSRFKKREWDRNENSAMKSIVALNNLIIHYIVKLKSAQTSTPQIDYYHSRIFLLK